jgi:hypothetical protein
VRSLPTIVTSNPSTISSVQLNAVSDPLLIYFSLLFSAFLSFDASVTAAAKPAGAGVLAKKHQSLPNAAYHIYPLLVLPETAVAVERFISKYWPK